jgi:aminoglycoside phosphotransferase (APT) family kinase protein
VSGAGTPVPVEPIHPIDATALARYMSDKAPGFGGGPIEVRQFQAGQSNPTYKVTTPDGAYVLRKKPAGKLLPSAHAIEREYAIMQALGGKIPVPRMRVLCEDESVLGQAFYVMDYVQGRVMPDARLLDAPKAERRDLSLELARVLARLHKLDHTTLGLTNFGRPDGYVARQLARWSKQYAASKVEENADMDRLIPWLEKGLPAKDEAAVVHGDYRGYNVIFAPDRPEILAVLDWELATIGHPLADLAYCCLPYYLPAEDIRGFQGQTLEELGIPQEAEMIEAYCKEAGRSELPDWRYFVVFALFRNASILAGVYKRSFDGTASNPTAHTAGPRYRAVAATAWRLAQSAP